MGGNTSALNSDINNFFNNSKSKLDDGVNEAFNKIKNEGSTQTNNLINQSDTIKKSITTQFNDKGMNSITNTCA